MTSFRQFMRKHKERDKDTFETRIIRVGNLYPSNFCDDFMYDALNDSTFPIIKSFDQLLDYMRKCNACREALEGGADAWRDYMVYRLRQGEI